MGFTKRRETLKSKLTVENFEEVKEQYLIDMHSIMKTRHTGCIVYLIDIHSIMKMEGIPNAFLLILFGSDSNESI